MNSSALKCPSISALRNGAVTVETNAFSEGHQLSVPEYTIGAKVSDADSVEIQEQEEVNSASDSDGSTTAEIMCGLSGTPY